MRAVLTINLLWALVLLLIAAGIWMVATARRNALRYLGIVFLAVPGGILVYVVSGIVAASLRGDGHFYSVPFGGYNIASSNTPIYVSVAVWISIVFFILAALLRRRI